MRITIDIDCGLLLSAKELAAKTNRSCNRIVEEALRAYLALHAPPTEDRCADGLPPGERKPRRQVRLPVSRAKPGLCPGVDLDNSAALLDLMEGHGTGELG